VTTVNTTVQRLSGETEKTVQQIAMTAEEARSLLNTIRPDIEATANNSARVSAGAQQLLVGLQEGKGTLGKLLKDETVYQQLRAIAEQSQVVVANVRDLTVEARGTIAEARGAITEARGAIVDFRSKDGPGLFADMRLTLAQAREATAGLAENMEALKHNFMFRGFFNRRGYFDLGALSPTEYRSSMLENGKRTALRIWLRSDVLFATGADGTEALTADGRGRVDAAMASYLRYLPGKALMVEGYATSGTTTERFVSSAKRAGLVREYVMQRYALTPQDTGFIALADDAKGNPGQGGAWEGIALTLFVDRQTLLSGETPAPKVGTR
jgi:phospholipid/cholesterol/gamma-HCH transport system substrate-binding protein